MRLFFLLLILLNLIYFLFVGISKPAHHVVNESGNSGIRPGIKELTVLTVPPSSRKNNVIHSDIAKQSQKIKADLNMGSLLPNESSSQSLGNKINYCYSLGPINGESNLSAIENYLKNTQQVFTVREVDQHAVSAYWVFLGKFNNPDQAKQVAKSLKIKGVTGFFIVKSGDNENSLSLGYFKNPDDAHKRQNDLVALGFPAHIKPQTIAKKIYWIDYTSYTTTKLLSNLRLDKLSGSDAIHQVRQTCPLPGPT